MTRAPEWPTPEQAECQQRALGYMVAGYVYIQHVWECKKIPDTD